MIRPLTCVCMVLAFGSGLYLYQAKHRVQLLDRDITETMRLTQSAQARTGVLRAEWTLLNDPERLAQLSDRFLSLKTVTPSQFTTMAELDKRLPAVRVPEAPKPADATDDGVPMAAEPEPDAPKVAALPEAKPEPPKRETPRPTPVKVATVAAPRPMERASDRQAERQAAERTAERRSQQAVAVVETRSVVSPAVTRIAAPMPAPRPSPYMPPVPMASPAPVVTSVLGMTRTNLAPPVPFQPQIGNGGG